MNTKLPTDQEWRDIKDGWIEHDLNIICDDCQDWGHRCHCQYEEANDHVNQQ